MCFRFRDFSLPFRFLSSASLLVPATWPSVSSFPLLPRFASQLLFGCCLSAFRLPGFSASVSPGFPCFPSASKYSAFCLFPFVLPSFAPAAVPLVLTFCFRFRSFPFSQLSFVRFLPVLTTQPLPFLFPASRSPLAVVPSVPVFPLPFRLLPCFPSDSGTQLPVLPFSRPCFASQRLLHVLRPSLRLWPFPLS